MLLKHHNRRFWNCVVAVGVLCAVPAHAVNSVPGRDPESDIALALTDLDNLSSRIETAAQMSARQGLGPQNIAARNAYDHALKFFRAKEWLSVIRELNNYLNLTQVPDSGDYLRAQYMLGRAYEAVSLPARSMRAYFRYLSTFLTARVRDDEQLVEVLRRMIPLAAQDGDATRELRELLSSMTAIELPEAAKPEVFFVAAKAAATTGDRKLAAGFLDKTLTTTEDPNLKARALYVRALMAISAKDYDTADEVLAEVIQTDDGVPGFEGASNRDLARLALARIAVRRKKPDTALRYYAAINDDSGAYKDALLESTYVHLGKKEDGEARAKAMLFVGKFPNAAETLQVRSLLAYLDLRAGDLESATESMASANRQLDGISKWVNVNMAGGETLTHERLADFLALSSGQLRPTPTVDEAAKLFGRLAEAQRRLADAGGELRDMVFTLGRANLEQLRPRWANRAEQLAKLSDEALTIGHRLAASERHLYEKRFSTVEAQMLKASETRRTNLLTPAAAAKRQNHDWARISTFFDLTDEIAASHKKLASAKAGAAAARYLLEDTKKKELRAVQGKRLEELETDLARAARASAETLTRLRKEKIESLVRQSPHHSARKFLAQYAAALHEEADVLRRARGAPGSAGEKLLATDAQDAWKRWQYVVDRLFEGFDGLDGEVRAGVRTVLAEIETHEARQRDLEGRLAGIRMQLERRLGGQMHTIAGRYGVAIDERLARHRKWQADIEWLRFQAQDDEEKKLKQRFDLETQILQDNLTDLQQGVLWKWPE